MIGWAKEETRKRILMAAFVEFYRNSFQGGSVNDIVEAAGTTKGALFHYFAGKNELGYAVVDEVIGPILEQRWMGPIRESANPIADLKKLFRKYVKEDVESGNYVYGCPLNNLAQEMSPLDKGFHDRINELYVLWRKSFAAAIEGGLKSGKVRKGVSARKAANLLVASQMGIWGTGKSSQSKELMIEAAEAVCDYLDGLKA